MGDAVGPQLVVGGGVARHAGDQRLLAVCAAPRSGVRPMVWPLSSAGQGETQASRTCAFWGFEPFRDHLREFDERG